MAKLTAEEMVLVKAIAPFELAHIFEEWARRDNLPLPDMEKCGGLGPPCLARHVPVGTGQVTREETPQEFGQRMAAGIWQLLKEA